MIPKNLRKTFSVLNQVYKKLFLITILSLILHLFDYVTPRSFDVNKPRSEHTCVNNVTVERYYEKRKYWLTSNLGSILFKNQPIEYHEQNRIFTVFIWKHPYWSKSFIRNPLSMCNVKNCIFTSNNSFIDTVDVILVNLYKNEFPWGLKRNTSQKWVFLTNESPLHNFVRTTNVSRNIAAIADIFNWSMTYRSDSDVPTPYGRTVPLSNDLMQKLSTRHITKIIPHWESKQRDVLVVSLMSNCYVPERMKYLEELQKYIKVDVYGKCTKDWKMKISCPGRWSDCPKINDYLFYLAFENSKCRQYITEKVFYNSLAKGAIPVVMGAPISDYEKFLPPHSFLHVNSFNSPRDLATEIFNLSMNDDYLELYHKWRYDFEIIIEDGNSGRQTYELCRLCQALNYNDDETKVYDVDTLRLYLDRDLLCTKYTQPLGTSRPTTTVPRTWIRPKLACRRRINN